jgi:hypothetical protein
MNNNPKDEFTFDLLRKTFQRFCKHVHEFILSLLEKRISKIKKCLN